jgi:hypothetical protein
MNSEPADKTPTPRRRWWLVGIALLVVVVVAVTTGFIVRKVQDRRQAAMYAAALPWLPKQPLLLTSSMRRKPVTGWKITADQLGQPPGTSFYLVGNIGDRALFTRRSADDQEWLVGIDVGRGKPLFAPVQLAAEGKPSFECFINGPNMAVCIQNNDPDKPVRAWVVDTENGTVLFDGSTELRLRNVEGHDQLYQVGDYVVANIKGEGIYGVGRHAELTWFVPGGGLVFEEINVWARDVVPSTMATAVAPGSDFKMVVFSLADGTVVHPSIPPDAKYVGAVVYPNAFGYDYGSSRDEPKHVVFYDNSGKELGRSETEGSLDGSPLDLPMVMTETKVVVLAVDGRTLLEFPRPQGEGLRREMKWKPDVEARLIGTDLFVTGDVLKKSYQRYDLRTGKAGKTCDREVVGGPYAGSDGDVAVGYGRGGGPVRAVDLKTCEKLWSLPLPQFSEVHRVNTTLVQVSKDAISSLVAPAR